MRWERVSKTDSMPACPVCHNHNHNQSERRRCESGFKRPWLCFEGSEALLTNEWVWNNDPSMMSDSSTCSSKDRDALTIFWCWIKGRKRLGFVCFYCYDETPWLKGTCGGKGLLGLHILIVVLKRPWGILLTDLLLLTCSVCSPLPPRNTYPGIVLPTVVCSLTYQSLIKKMHQQVCQSDRSSIFFKVNSSLCQVDQNPTRIRICFRYLSTDCIPLPKVYGFWCYVECIIT